MIRKAQWMMGLLLIMLSILIPVAYSFMYQQQSQDITQTIVNKYYTPALITYRSNTGINLLNSPKERTWNGASWSAPEMEMATAGSPVRWVRMAYSPIEAKSYEKIVVTLSGDGYLDAYVWNGDSWTVTNNIGFVGAIANAYKCFDVAYEKTSGEALLVYAISSTDPAKDLAYRTWSFTNGWSSEQYLDDTGHTTDVQYYWIQLATKWTNGANEIGLIGIDGTNTDANAWIWDGSSWGNFIEITGTVAIATEECIAIESERLSGAFMAVAGEGQFIKWARFTTSWSAVGIFDINNMATAAMNWLTLKSSQGNRLMLTSVDSALDLCTAVWDEGLYGNRQWSTAAQSIGSMTATTSVTAMRFTAQASKSVTNILVFIHAAVAPPAYRFGIETSNAGYMPSGTYVGGASNYAVHTPTATGWLNIALPSPAPLTAGTVYHITVRYDSGTIGTSNYIALRMMGIIKNDFRVTENKIDPWLNTIFGATIQNREPIFVLMYSDGTYEAMPYDTAMAHNIFGANWFSEKWTQSGAQTITGVNIPLAKLGIPLDNLYVVLRNETDSQDVATITIPQGDITTTLQWYERYFDYPVVLMDGKTYRLILKSPSSTLTAYFICRSLSTGQSGSLTYDGTNSVYSASTNSGSSWTDTTTRDLTYILLGGGTTLGNWIVHAPHDTSVDTHAQRCADFAWEPTGSKGLLVWGTTAGQITYRTFTAPNTWGSSTSTAMGANIHPWVQLKSNTRSVSGDVKILGAVLEGTVSDIGAIKWDGTTFTVIGPNTISSDTTVTTYECFEMEFQNF